jgi:uncharacterized protein (TIGR03085 family)
VEYFVHHEDVRRALPDWTERELPAGLEQALWKRLKGARLFLRAAPTGIALVRDADRAAGDVIEAKTAPPAAGPASRVEVIGTPAELTMWSTGRVSAAHVTLDGPQDAVTKLKAWRH